MGLDIGVNALDSDVLRWMSQADDSDSRGKKREKKKWKYRISSWMGTPREGEWVPESVATTVKRTFQKHTHSAESTKKKPVIVTVEVEELVYMHHGYRPRFPDESAARKSFFFRGARIWRK